MGDLGADRGRHDDGRHGGGGGVAPLSSMCTMAIEASFVQAP